MLVSPSHVMALKVVDIFFFNSPKKIIDEFLRSKKKIYLTEHSFENKKDANFAN